MISREALVPVISLSLAAGVLTVGAIVTPMKHLTVFAVLAWLFVAFTLFFFRDPERHGPRGSDLVLAAADGKIVGIDEVNEPDYIKGKCLRISIFLSIFDVHINRAPVSGVVEYFTYRKGEFLPAYKKDASRLNEQTVIGIRSEKAKILVKQIAGILARRIVCYIREGSRVEQGERFGMIRFGSRTEIFVPLSAKPTVKVGDKVRAGETVVARLVEAE